MDCWIRGVCSSKLLGDRRVFAPVIIILARRFLLGYHSWLFCYCLVRLKNDCR